MRFLNYGKNSHSTIRLLIDGLVYSLQNFGGTITYWNNTINCLAKLGIKPTLFLQSKNNFPAKLKNHVNLTSSEMNMGNYNLFHSSKYTLPPQSVNLKQIVTVHDTICEVFSSKFSRVSRKNTRMY